MKNLMKEVFCSKTRHEIHLYIILICEIFLFTLPPCDSRVRVCLLCRSLQWQERKEHVLSDFNSQFWNSISPHPSQPMGAQHGHFLTHLNSSLGNFEVQWENLMVTILPLQEDNCENIIFIALLNMILQFYHIYVWS